MSLQEMAWLTQGPMAAVDLELDVESMEQEAVEDDFDWQPPEMPPPPPPPLTSLSKDSPEVAPPPPAAAPSEQLPVPSQRASAAAAAAACLPVSGNITKPNIQHGLTAISAAESADNSENSFKRADRLLAKALLQISISSSTDGLNSTGHQLAVPDAKIRHKRSRSLSAGRRGSGRPDRSSRDLSETRSGSEQNKDAGTVDKTPPWRSRLARQMSADHALINSPVTSSRSAEINNTLQPKFGAIKVHAGILGSRDDNHKSFVVTNETTSRDLVSIVLASYHVVCESHSLFGLVLEKSNKRFGFSGNQRTIKLQDSSKPLELQAKYNRADTRFCLQLRPGAGTLTVHDSLAKDDKKVEDKPTPCIRRIFVTDKATCRDVIQLVLRAHEMDAKPDDFCLFEVDSNSKGTHELCSENKPLILQQQWLDPHEYYFQIKHKGAPQEKRMRRHSIGSSADVRSSRGHHTSGKVLNFKQTGPSGKSLIPRIWNTMERRGSCLGPIMIPTPIEQRQRSSID